MSKVRIDIYNFSKLRATVVKVVDGDTVDLDIDYGVCFILQRVRLLNVDAPEKVGTSRPQGILAKTAVSCLIPAGTIVYVSGQGKDLYGRILGRILFNNCDLSDLLVEKQICKKCTGSRSEWTSNELELSSRASNILIKQSFENYNYCEEK